MADTRYRARELETSNAEGDDKFLLDVGRGLGLGTRREETERNFGRNGEGFALYDVRKKMEYGEPSGRSNRA